MNVQRINRSMLPYLDHTQVCCCVAGLGVSILMIVLNTNLAQGQPVKKITASDGAPGDFFGGDTEIGGAASVALFGDTAIVGASRGNSAYVFHRDEGGSNDWGLAAELNARGWYGDVALVDGVAVSGAGSGRLFTRNENGVWDEGIRLGAGGGLTVALSGDTAVIGDRVTNDYTGAASVLNRDEGGINNWGRVARLTASDSSPSDFFGSGLGISANTLMVSSPLDDDDGRSSGSVYVFEQNESEPNNWAEVAKLTASDPKAGDWFGISVDMHGDTAIVGATQWNVGNGAAYILNRNEGGPDNWGEIAKLTASDGASDDGFGESVAIFGDLAVVGAVRDRFHSGTARDSGSAYVFSRNQGGLNSWGEILKLSAPDHESNDHFGKGVDIFENTIVVTAPGYNENTGAAYIFEVPQPGQMLVAGDADQNHSFDQLDIVQVLQASKYLTGEPATWGEGDWDGAPGGHVGAPPAGDGIFDQLDIIKALATGLYMTGPHAAVRPDVERGEPVPEPSSIVLMVMAFITLATRRAPTRRAAKPL